MKKTSICVFVFSLIVVIFNNYYFAVVVVVVFSYHYRYTSDLEKAFWEIWGRYLRQEVRSHVDVASLTDSVFDARYILTTSPKPSASISSDSNIVKNSNSTMTNKTALKRKSTAIPRKSAAANLENDKSTMLMCQKKCAETCAVTKKYFCSCSCSSPTPNSLL